MEQRRRQRPVRRRQRHRVLQVNGSSTGDDEFTIAPGTRAGHVQFDRISLNGATAGNFGIDNTTIEQVQVNGLGGNDRATGSAGLAALLPQGLALNGGDGDDILTGGDSADAIDGGAGDDTSRWRRQRHADLRRRA